MTGYGLGFEDSGMPVAGSSCMMWMPSEKEPKDIHQFPLASTKGAGSIAFQVVLAEKPHGLGLGTAVVALVHDETTHPLSVHGP